jgi:hypothetical protein
MPRLQVGFIAFLGTSMTALPIVDCRFSICVVAIRQICRIAPVPCRWQDASGPQGRDGFATSAN